MEQPPFRVRVKGVETQSRMELDPTGQHEPKARVDLGPIGVRFELQLQRGGSRAMHELVRSDDARKGALLLLLHSYPSDQLAAVAPAPLVFGRVIRPPMEVLQEDDRICWELSASFDDHSLVLREPGWLPLLLVAQSFFAHEPILAALQETITLPFREELLQAGGGDSPAPTYAGAERVLACAKRNVAADGIQLDDAQRAAFEHACAHRVANIVGPPGTGKTFLGVELAHAILQSSEQRLLVVCYTNHALDQFLEAMIVKKGWGLPEVARLGVKSKNEELSKFSVWDRVRDQRTGNADKSECGSCAARKRGCEDISRSSANEFVPSRHNLRCPAGLMCDCGWSRCIPNCSSSCRCRASMTAASSLLALPTSCGSAGRRAVIPGTPLPIEGACRCGSWIVPRGGRWRGGGCGRWPRRRGSSSWLRRGSMTS